MRLTSAMWFAVFMRTETERGAYVSTIKKGAQQAGAIFIMHNHLNGTFSLYGPAPQSMYMDALDDDRRFERVLENVEESVLDTYLEKQKNFDPDLWVIETESGKGEPTIKLAE